MGKQAGSGQGSDVTGRVASTPELGSWLVLINNAAGEARLENGIGYSGVKLHNDDREPVWGRGESDSAGKAYDSTKAMTAVKEVLV